MHPVHLARREDVGGGMTRITIEPPPFVARSFHTPGQYLRTSVGPSHEEGYFALDHAPGEPTWSWILRENGEASRALAQGELGFAFRVSEALGTGFPFAKARGRPLLVVALGTGIGAARSILEMRAKEGEPAELFFGLRRPDELPLRNELLGFQAQGIRTTVCLSQTAAPASFPLPHAQGRTIDVLRREGGHRPGGMIFGVGGPQDFFEALKVLAPSLGIRQEDVASNLG